MSRSGGGIQYSSETHAGSRIEFVEGANSAARGELVNKGCSGKEKQPERDPPPLQSPPRAPGSSFSSAFCVSFCTFVQVKRGD